jgi:hypothetical protein
MNRALTSSRLTDATLGGGELTATAVLGLATATAAADGARQTATSEAEGPAGPHLGMDLVIVPVAPQALLSAEQRSRLGVEVQILEQAFSLERRRARSVSYETDEAANPRVNRRAGHR